MKNKQFRNTLMLLLIISTFFLACNATENVNSMNSNGYITIIVCEADLTGSASHPNRATSLVASLILYNGFTVCRESLDKEMNGKIASDTLSFYTNSSTNSLCLAIIDQQDMYNYPAHPGDTLFVNVRKGKPYVTSTWKDQKEYDFIWPNEIESRVSSLYPDKVIKGQKKFHLKTEENYKMIGQYLDSLFQENSLSNQVYEQARLNVKCFIDNLKLAENSKKKDFSLNLFHQNDSALGSDAYRSMLMKYANRNVDFKNYNPIDLFNNILNDTILTFKSKSYLLFNILSVIAEPNIMEIFQPKADVFLKFVNDDPIWKQYVESITPMPTSTSKEMQLYDIDMQQVDLAELMSTYKGKVVYIDVWASWCAPCRAAMPAAKELRTKYKDQSVVFLYLAYNDQQNPWKKGVNQYNLNEGNAVSFLIATPKAKWVKDMEIKTIPRYMIYDKNGKLISKKAPGPEDSQLIELINSLL